MMTLPPAAAIQARVSTWITPQETHVEQAPGGRLRLAAARHASNTDPARANLLHLTGLAIEEQPELTHYMEEARALVRRRVAADRAHLVALAETAGVGYSVADLAVPVDGSLDEVLQRCRLSDLAVVGQAAARDEFHAELIRRLPLDSSAPVLVVPIGDVRFDRAAIAWDGRPVTAHAIHSALPLLELATTVTIVSVVRGGEPGPDTAALTAYLGRHGIEAAHRTIIGSGSVADTLRGFVRSERIDWITMRAFGRRRQPDPRDAGGNDRPPC